MFTWVGSQFANILGTYVLGVVTTLAAAITPVALTAMTIWVVLYGWAVLRQEVAETVPTFAWKVFKLGLILAFALQSGFYVTNVSDSANGLAMGVATTFLPTSADPATLTSPYALLDRFNDDASAQVADIMKEADMFRLDLFLAAAVFSIGSVVFLCIALFVVTLAKVFLTFVIAVGPLFILCLAWRPTQRFFDSWLSMVLNAVVLTWFAFFALGLSDFIGMAMFKAIKDGGGLIDGNFNVLAEAIRYCVLMILMGIICLQAPSLASSLTGGAAVQHGIQMVQNTMMVAGIWSATSSSRAANLAVSGGVMHRGVGLPYAAGSAAGRLMRQGQGAGHMAAYRLAALRGQA